MDSSGLDPRTADARSGGPGVSALRLLRSPVPLDCYELRGVIAEGSTAIVYLGTDQYMPWRLTWRDAKSRVVPLSPAQERAANLSWSHAELPDAYADLARLKAAVELAKNDLACRAAKAPAGARRFGIRQTPHATVLVARADGRWAAACSCRGRVGCPGVWTPEGFHQEGRSSRGTARAEPSTTDVYTPGIRRPMSSGSMGRGAQHEGCAASGSSDAGKAIPLFAL